MKLINRGWVAYLAMLAGGVAIGVTAVGTAAASQSRPAAVASTSTTTVRHFTIAASAFAPDSLHGTTNDYFNLWNPSTLSNSQAGRCFDAAASLPNGATIRSVIFFYTNGATNQFFGELNRQNLATHGSKILAQFTSTPTGTSPVYAATKKSISTSNVVDTSRFAYSFGVCPFGDSTFTGVMVNYTG
jgi:hypothetical protein